MANNLNFAKVVAIAAFLLATGCYDSDSNKTDFPEGSCTYIAHDSDSNADAHCWEVEGSPFWDMLCEDDSGTVSPAPCDTSLYSYKCEYDNEIMEGETEHHLRYYNSVDPMADCGGCPEEVTTLP